MLTAAAEGRIHALVLLGADPVADFPDRDLARRALTSVGSLIAVDTFVTESSRHASVVLAAAAYGEKGGTTTNLEGRVTRLAQKVVSPGAARADWMIAAELADFFETDLGFESSDDIWDEIERVAPAHAGATLALVRAPGRADGVLIPPAGDPAAGARDLAEVMARDPAAAVAPPTVVDGSTGSVGLRVRGLARGDDVTAPVARPTTVLEPTPAGPDPDAPAGPDPDAPAGPDPDAPAGDPVESPVPKPAPLRWEAPATLAPPPKLDSYSLRLVAGRTLYDGWAVSVARTPHLAALVGPSPVRVNPFELERLGVPSGGTVHLIGARGTLTMPAVADAGLPRGSACLPFNRSTPGAAELIDARDAVTEVRLETM
jgi:predicted molibdopterin-dependent oxidoreductase YjgC